MIPFGSAAWTQIRQIDFRMDITFFSDGRPPKFDGLDGTDVEAAEATRALFSEMHRFAIVNDVCGRTGFHALLATDAALDSIEP